jgi:4-hydroxybenzoate polyprenyltransferase
VSDAAPPRGGELPDARRGNWVDTLAPVAMRPYLRLARFDRPIGWWLLLLPCWWSAGLAAVAAGHPLPNPWHCLLFLIGAVVMRGAGCTFNDIIDRDLDAGVARTRNRPLPAGDVTVKQAVLWLGLQCLIGLVVLLQFNWPTVLLGAASLIVVAIYPFMKRVTGMPQGVLGLAFSWGALVGWSAVFGSVGWPALMLYAAAVLWTIGYDTIYALQDIEDDAIVGIRSSARTFGAHTKLAITLCYAGAAVLTLGAVLLVGGGIVALSAVGCFAAHLAWQVQHVQGATPQRALQLFRSNRDAGLILAIGFALAALARHLWG